MLAGQYDFNFFDAFKIFDLNSNGYIDFFELRQGLRDVGVFANDEELKLFFKRYDQNGDGKLKFSEFCNAFTPLDAFSASQLNRRHSTGKNAPYFPKDECFSFSTRLAFKDMWRTHFRIEAREENNRQRQQQRPFFSGFDAFDTCDINKDGCVTKNEIKEMMDRKGIYISDREASTLVDKFDKNKDGRITYSEFMEENIPKSPVKM